MRVRRARSIALGWLFVIALGASPGCRDADEVKVELHARTPREGQAWTLQVEAQVAGPLDELRYRWYSISGQCNPQESRTPSTTFQFADGGTKDRITVEVWRANHQVGTAELDVQFDEGSAFATGTEDLDLRIEFTTIPPADIGGENSRADIAGRVVGPIPPGYAVVVFAYAYGTWFVQPDTGMLHSIEPDGTWATWTHTGSSYAALVVSPEFRPPPRIDILPPIGSMVLARSIVEGMEP